MTVKIQEKDLFYPLKDFYENLGYQVEGEVKDCDVLVKTDDDFMVIELKTNINFKVVLQAVERQKMFELVFVAVPVQNLKLSGKAYKEKIHLLKRLGIGLLLVNSITNEVECVAKPLDIERSRIIGANRKKKERVISEFEKRLVKNNVGGVNHQKITTYYRQQCYQVAYLLKEGPQSAADLAKKGLDHKRVYTILKGNFYGWFERKQKGIYQLTELGHKEIETQKEIIEILMNELKPCPIEK